MGESRDESRPIVSTLVLVEPIASEFELRQLLVTNPPPPLVHDQLVLSLAEKPLNLNIMRQDGESTLVSISDSMQRDWKFS